jgi:hypothetical protein
MEYAPTRVGLQRNGTAGTARLAVELTRAFRRLRNWRVGIEARISHLKRAFGLRRSRLRRLVAFAPGRAGDIRLHPAAHDRGRRVTREQEAGQPSQHSGRHTG